MKSLVEQIVKAGFLCLLFHLFIYVLELVIEYFYSEYLLHHRCRKAVYDQINPGETDQHLTFDTSDTQNGDAFTLKGGTF